MLGQTISHYRILSKLGEGGMGVVYVAEDTLLGRLVAIKTLNVEGGKQHYRQRFLREARAISALNHPNIAIVHEYGETPDGKPFMVMELIQGQTLGELLSKRTLTLARVLEIIEGVAQALAEAHRCGIIHRDIKPSNVIVNERNEVKVLDFGLAKHFNSDILSAEGDSDARALLATKTREGVVIGTPHYLSPEQALGVSVDNRSDIFSLGALLYECIAGRPAFPGTSFVEVCAKVVRDETPPPSQFNANVPPELDRLTLKALAKKADDRFQTIEELLSDLRQAQTGLRHDVVASGAPVSLSSPRLRRQQQQLSPSSLFDIFNRPRPLLAVFMVAMVLGVALWALLSLREEARAWASPEAARRYAEATAALRSGTYYKAKKLLEDAVKLDEGASLAHAGLAETLLELDDVARAKEEIAIAEKLAPNRALSAPERLYIAAVGDAVRLNFAGAIQKYQEIVRQTPAEDVLRKSHALIDLGRADERIGDMEKALESYLEARRYDPQSAASFLRLGTLYGLMNKDQDAAEAFAKAEALYETSDIYEGVTEVLYQRSAFLYRTGKGDEARSLLERALGIIRTTTHNTFQEIRALLLLSGIACAESRPDEAKGYASQALALAKAGGMENLTTLGLIELGGAFILKRQFDDAEKYLKQALEFAEKYKSSFNEARAHFELGRMYIQKEGLDEGLFHLERALEFYRRVGLAKEIIEILLLKGRGTLLKGNHEAAFRILEEASEFSKQLKAEPQLASSHTEIGYLLATLELYPSALRQYEESYRINRALDNSLRTAHSLMSRGDMLWRLGRYDEAETALSQSSVIAARVQGEYGLVLSARIELALARLKLSQRNFPEAITKSRRALDLAGARVKYAAIEARYTLGLALALSGASGQGIAECRQAVRAAMSAPFADRHLVGGALLALAEAQLAGGKYAAAYSDALRAQEQLAPPGYQESEYRAQVIAALAAQRVKGEEAAREHLSRADGLLLELQRKWGEADFYNYLTRADVRFYRDQIRDLSNLAAASRSR